MCPSECDDLDLVVFKDSDDGRNFAPERKHTIHKPMYKCSFYLGTHVTCIIRVKVYPLKKFIIYKLMCRLGSMIYVFIIAKFTKQLLHDVASNYHNGKAEA